PRLLPFRQQAVRIDFDAGVITNTFLNQTTLYGPIAPGVKQVGASAYVLGADEDLRNGLCACAGRKDGTNLSAQIVFLILDGVQINTTVLNTHSREKLPDRPTELAPLEREQHDGLSTDDPGDKPLRAGIGLDARRFRRGCRRR